jgi:multidrug efflux pump subunit AcrA (membrane-fusion protein)
MWHPWGFFVATVAVTATIIAIENQQYYYDQGVYYIESDGGYTVVQAPVGATVTVLPEGSQTVQVSETVNNYYYGGTYYEKSGEGYTVVPPTAGTVVENLPEGGEEVKVGDVTYVKFGETYYQPIQQNGKNMYEVVEVKEGDK